MGHQRLGKLPARRLLPEIVRYLIDGGQPTVDLVQQITEFSRDALRQAVKDPGFIEALWLLVKLPQVAAEKNGTGNGKLPGISDAMPNSVVDVLANYDLAIETVQRKSHAGLTDLGEIARQAGLSSLADSLQKELPTLWRPTAEDVQTSLAVLKGTEEFAGLAHRFFGNFVERSIHYYVDRNLHNMVGDGRVAATIADMETFSASIRRHCDEAALIMRAFARDWLGKNHYKEGKAISRSDIRQFSAYVVEKIGIELENRRGNV
jgi:hypothetical protein